MLENIKAVIFDLDGTVIDSMWMWKRIDIEYLGRFGIEMPADLQRQIEGMSFSETAMYFKDVLGVPDSIDEIKQAWNDMAMYKYTHDVGFKDGALEFLKKLRAAGIRTGIATSNSRELVSAVMGALDAEQYFDEIHTSCEVPKGKPAPDIYLLVAERLKVDPSECLVFEDVPLGILAGKNAGMKVCGVEDSFSAGESDLKKEMSDYYIYSYDEIKEL